MNSQENWWNSKIGKYFKKKRFEKICEILNLDLNAQCTLLDVGSANGKDFIQYLDGRENISITALDIDDYNIPQTNVTQVRGDAQSLPFADNQFDYVVSMGVLEHIQPIEKLCDVISEIERVSKAYCIVMPAINTNLEPHLRELRWQMKDFNKKKHLDGVAVNYFSDEAWLAFNGFKDAKSQRFWYIPGVFSNIAIYKNKD